MLPLPRVIHVPREQALIFEGRATAAFPFEIEDILLGEVHSEFVEIVHIIPTLHTHFLNQSRYGVTIRDAAYRRAKLIGRKSGLRMLGSIHTHPYKQRHAHGLSLSTTDRASFASFPPGAIFGVLEIVSDRHIATSFHTAMGFFTADSTDAMRLKTL